MKGYNRPNPPHKVAIFQMYKTKREINQSTLGKILIKNIPMKKIVAKKSKSVAWMHAK